MRIKAGEKFKTTSKTHHELLEFKIMPFGLTNAPVIFQSLMNTVFVDQMRKFILVFFDDILVYSKTMNEHVKHLEIVLKLLKKINYLQNKVNVNLANLKWNI